MDEWKSERKSTMPQLVVKIVGGKQIKYFIDTTKCPTVQLDVNSSEERAIPSSTVMNEDISRTSSGQNLEHLRQVQHTENLLAALRQVPERQCVTAPCGDRSRSYIHLKNTNNLSNPKLMGNPHITGTQTEEPVKSSTESWLFSAIAEELQDLEAPTFQNTEEVVNALDPFHSGTVHQSELTYLFLKQKIPLKLSTLAHLFKFFSNTTNPEQVRYKELLQFIGSALKDEAEIWDASRRSVASTDLESVRDRSVMIADPREMWLQRFHMMEMALQMCDSTNTGYVDRGLAIHLIQNYSLNFDLNLSPFKVNEVTRNTQREGKVNLASALQQLKEL